MPQRSASARDKGGAEAVTLIARSVNKIPSEAGLVGMIYRQDNSRPPQNTSRAEFGRAIHKRDVVKFDRPSN